MAESEENETKTLWEKSLMKDQTMKEGNLLKRDKNSKDEEEQLNSTLYTGNELKISIKELNWETEDDRSTLATQETEQQQLVYITNLEDDL